MVVSRRRTEHTSPSKRSVYTSTVSKVLGFVSPNTPNPPAAHDTKSLVYGGAQAPACRPDTPLSGAEEVGSGLGRTT